MGETHLIETSSGNAGTAFAKYCDLHGFDGTIVFSKEVRKARLASVKTDKVKVEVSKYDNYMKGARKRMLEIVREHRDNNSEIFIMNHSQIWESVEAMQDCGDEVASDFKELAVKPDIFVSALGNGTSTTGIGLALQEHFPSVEIVGFEPAKAPVFHHKLNGLGPPECETS